MVVLSRRWQPSVLHKVNTSILFHTPIGGQDAMALACPGDVPGPGAFSCVELPGLWAACSWASYHTNAVNTRLLTCPPPLAGTTSSAEVALCCCDKHFGISRHFGTCQAVYPLPFPNSVQTF